MQSLNDMHRLIILIAFLLLSIASRAQTARGTIKGKISDTNGKALDGTDILLSNGNDSTVIKRTFSDTMGNFQFTDINDGSYFISVQLIGFTKAKSSVFSIANGTPSINPVDVTLQPLARALNSVNIVSSKPLIENKIDKTVVNVGAYITNSGNTALDLLGTAPNVAVDQSSGTISVKGKSGAIILIDGKQTYLGGTDLMALLNSMPSAQIDQIEIMTQPSAKYDASGNSGVINILTKKKNKAGFNVNISLNYTQGVYPKTLNTVVFNYYTSKVNIFGNISYNYNQTFTNRKWLRYFTSDSLNNLFAETNRDFKTTSNILVSAGADYTVSPKTTIGILASRNDSKYDDSFTYNSSLQNFNNNGATDGIADGLSTYHRPWINNSLNLNFRTALSKTQQLTSDLNYDKYDFQYHENDSTVNENPDGSFNNQFLQRVDQPTSIDIYSAKVDYSYKMNTALNIDAGVKTSFVKTDNDAKYFQFANGAYTLNTSLSNHFIYKENVNAAYINYSGTVGKWNLQGGLRGEQTDNQGQQLVGDQNFSKNYIQFFPSLYIGYLPEKNNQYVLSYSKRVDRPNYASLNPFIQYVDVYTRSSGNTGLDPVIAHNFELDYNYKNSLNISAFYTVTNGIINPVYLQSDTSNLLLIQVRNVTREMSEGFNVNYSIQPKNWWTITAFYILFNNHFKGQLNNGYLDQSQTTQMINLTQQFLLGNGWAAEMNIAYRSKTLLFAMFYRGPFRANSYGLSKDIFNKKGSLKLKITDPFNLTRNNYNYTQFGGLYIARRFHEENQKVGITFTYRISEGQKSSVKKQKNYQPEENQRVGMPGS